MHKRVTAAVLAVLLWVGLLCPSAQAVLFDQQLYLKQQTRSTCTLSSATMLLRRKAVLDADANWWTITEPAVRRVAWSGGLAWNFTYNGVHITVLRKSSGWAGSSLDSKRQALIQLLEAHPEGIVAYSTSQPHAVLLTDYDYNTGLFYCCDPAQYYPEGRIVLTRSSLKGDSQDAVLSRIDQLWYADSGVSNGAGTDPWAENLILPPAVTVPAELPPAPPVELARDAVQEVEIDGAAVQLQMYALTDEQGNDVNFVKLRDMAQALNGSEAQFNVGYDGTVSVTTRTAYVSGGTEEATPFHGDQPYTSPAALTTVDGQAVELDAIQLTDSTGGGHTYYNLRDLGEIVGFQVSWDSQAGIRIDTALS